MTDDGAIGRPLVEASGHERALTMQPRWLVVA
jgi:hypothetical protein